MRRRWCHEMVRTARGILSRVLDEDAANTVYRFEQRDELPRAPRIGELAFEGHDEAIRVVGQAPLARHQVMGDSARQSLRLLGVGESVNAAVARAARKNRPSASGRRRER